MFISVLFAFIAQNSKSKTTKKFFVTLVILSLAIPAGLRDISVGLDTWSYIRAIQSASFSYSGELFYTYFEGGFSLIIKALAYVFNEPHYVILIIALVTNTLIIKTLWAFKDKYSFSFSVFLYYSLYYFESYNILRQYLAMSIIFYGMRFILDRRYVTFSVLTLLASSIHGAAIIGLLFIPVHVLVEKKMLLKHKILFSILIFSIAIFSGKIVSILGINSTIEKYLTYYIRREVNQNINIGFFFLLRIAIVFFSLFILNKKGFSDYRFSKYIIFLNFLGTILTMGGYIYRFAGRLGTYAMIAEIILWSMLIGIKYKSLAILLRFGIILLSLYLFYNNLNGSTQGHMPYKMFWGF